MGCALGNNMNTQRMFELTKKLISIPSVTGEEGEIGKYVGDYLEKMALAVTFKEVEKDRFNIYAHLPNHTPRILFNTHLDTVPPAYGPEEDEHNIYGRGACDTHGVLAAQLEAILKLIESGFKDVGILLVVGEETNHVGAAHACKTFPEPEF